MTMTNQEIKRIAMHQSAIDSHCCADDFLSSQPKIVLSADDKRARRYLELPFICDLTSYGYNIVASVSPELWEPVNKYIHSYPAEHCFETPNMQMLSDELEPYGMAVCFMAEYFLPDVKLLHPLTCPYETRLLGPDDLSAYYLPAWQNALCEKRRHLDVLAVGAFDKGQLVGLAGCSADCDTMWQIGIDVLPDYRRQGIACALTSHLAIEVLQRDIVPFYCCAWSNIGSARNAIKSGFRPAWVQLTVKERTFVDKANAITR